MAFEIILAPKGERDYKALNARWRATIRKALERHLRHEPQKISKSRIKRLEGMRRPQYRLRVNDRRIFYDLESELKRVEILRIISKQLAQKYLDEEGISDEESATD